MAENALDTPVPAPLPVPAVVQTAKSSKKPRSRTEQTLTRGLILGLIVIVALQGYARYAYSKTLSLIDGELAAIELSKEAAFRAVLAADGGSRLSRREVYVRALPNFRPSLTESKVKQWIYGFPSRSVETLRENINQVARVDTYTWRGLFKSYALRMNFSHGDDPHLFNVDSSRDADEIVN